MTDGLSHALADWMRTQPERATTLRQVQREAPTRPLRRHAAQIIAEAEAAGLIVRLPTGSIVAGSARREAWAVRQPEACDSGPRRLIWLPPGEQVRSPIMARHMENRRILAVARQVFADWQAMDEFSPDAWR